MIFCSLDLVFWKFGLVSRVSFLVIFFLYIIDFPHSEFFV